MSESENRRPRSSRSQPSREGARREDRETGGYRRDDRGESRGEGRGGPRGGDRRGGGGRRDDRRSTGGSREAGRSRGDGPAADRRGTGPGELRPDQNPNRPPRKPRVPEPPLPDDVTGQELDRSVHHQLRTLTKENAEGVARHLVMVAATLAADETQLALAHAETAVRRAGRVPAAREALGMVAYRMGDYNRALGEFRTVRRLSGSSHLLALMVDCERGLGRFDRALELASSPEARTLTAAEREELTIVVSGVRRDMGQDAAALVALQGPGLGARVPSGCSTPMPTPLLLSGAPTKPSTGSRGPHSAMSKGKPTLWKESRSCKGPFRRICSQATTRRSPGPRTHWARRTLTSDDSTVRSVCRAHLRS